MANDDREFKEGEDREEDSGSSGGEVGSTDGSVMLESFGAEEQSPTTEGDPPIIIQGGGNT